jgi:hypothetical protein
LPIGGTLNAFLGSLGSGQGSAGGSGIEFGSLNSSLINSGGTPNISGARAQGGPVQKGKNFLVGERGKEIFQPSTNGRIIPNDKIGGTQTIIVEQNIILQAGVSQTIAAELENFKPLLKEETIAAIIEAKGRGELGGEFN